MHVSFVLNLSLTRMQLIFIFVFNYNLITLFFHKIENLHTKTKLTKPNNNCYNEIGSKRKRIHPKMSYLNKAQVNKPKF